MEHVTYGEAERLQHGVVAERLNEQRTLLVVHVGAVQQQVLQRAARHCQVRRERMSGMRVDILPSQRKSNTKCYTNTISAISYQQ